ncbi:Elongation factor Ts [Buchnera aphidicola (Pterocallis alni)]|uniref:translation elongation factor Ts n=1 Tax=Buchnera aphidicola TaxID=9 RepID=UPI003464C9D7
MVKIDSSLIKELRLKSGGGIIDCRNALINSGGNINEAMIFLKKNGLIKAEKKNNNIALKGIIDILINKDVGYMLELNCETDFVAQHIDFINFAKYILNICFTNNIKNLQSLKLLCEEKRVKLVSVFGENIIIRRIYIIKGENILCYLHRNKIGVLIRTNSTNYDLIKNIAMHIAANNPIYLSKEEIPIDILEDERKIQFDIAINNGKKQFIAKKIVNGKMDKFIKSLCLLEQNLVMSADILVKDLIMKNSIIIFEFIRFECGEIF